MNKSTTQETETCATLNESITEIEVVPEECATLKKSITEIVAPGELSLIVPEETKDVASTSKANLKRSKSSPSMNTIEIRPKLKIRPISDLTKNISKININTDEKVIDLASDSDDDDALLYSPPTKKLLTETLDEDVIVI